MQRFIFSTLIFLWCVAASFGQTSAGVGAVSGVVTDPSGATVQGATVIIENEALGIRRTITTTAGGVFNAPALVPHAGYSAVVSAPGFTTFENRGVTVHVGQNVAIAVKLEVQSAVTKVEVEERAPVVDQLKTDVSQTIDETQINNLLTAVASISSCC